MFHTTYDFPLLLGDGSGRVVVPAPLPPSPPPEPPPPGAQLTSMSWSVGSTLSLLANAAAGSELVLTTGQHDHRADRPATITTADGDVSSWTSGQSLAGTVTQATAANRPTHSQATGIVTFSGATSGTDTATGKWLGFPTGAGTLPTRYADSSNNALGIAYLLVRFARSALDMIGGFGELADQAGISTDALQAFQFAATQTGISAEELQRGIQALKRRIADAAEGQGDAANQLRRLGIAFLDASAMARKASC